MTESEFAVFIKGSLKIELANDGDACGSEFIVARLLWEGEVISEDRLQTNSTE